MVSGEYISIKDYDERLDESNLIDDLIKKYKSIWWDTYTEFPKFDKKYNKKEKKKNEISLDNFLEKFLKDIKNIPTDSDEYKKYRDKMMNYIKKFSKDVLEFTDEHINIMFCDGYYDVTNDFIKKSKSFNPDLDIYDTFQAIRNVWIMNSIQMFLEKEVKLTPSIFAYSMLYPYSDNYLDNPEFSIDEKIDFNNRFRMRLEGKKVEPTNNNEEDIFKLVGIIEEEFPRKKYTDVYNNGLLAIHKGQEKSVIQQTILTFPYEKDILGISFEKGGTSVLADGYLISGKLSKNEANFMFGYGVFLQLADDLQDVKEDLENNHMTIFSQLAYKWPLDKITNRLFWFMKNVLNSIDLLLSSYPSELKDIIETSCIYLLFGAIAENKSLYTKDYINKIEKHYKFRFSSHKKIKKKFRKMSRDIDINDIKDKMNNIENVLESKNK